MLRMRNLVVIFFLGLLFPMQAISQYQNSEAGDLQALIDLYQSTNGNNWTNTQENNKPWDPNATSLPDNTDWYGVTTEVINGERRVVHLDLQRGSHSQPEDGSDPSESGVLLGNNAEGQLPASLGNLSKIRYFNVKQNKLTGDVPQGLSEWTEVRRILLTGHTREPRFFNFNHPTGGGAVSGKTTYATNSFTGSIPNPSKWANIEVFESQQNASPENPNQGTGLTGTLPPEFSQTPISMIIIAHNSLEGSLPAEWGDCENLHYINVSDNNLTGNLPHEWGQLNMYHIRLGYNNLSDSNGIPESWGNWSILDSFNVKSNNLSGPFPTHILETGALYFNLGFNNFSGELPETIDTSNMSINTALVFDLVGNNFSGALPGWLTDQRIIQFDVSHNNFNGDLPVEFHDSNKIFYQRLRLFRIQQNNFTGQLPSANLGPDIFIAQMGNNDFTGSLPDEWGNIATSRNLTLEVHNNNLSGPIPVEVANLTSTSTSGWGTLDIRNNKFTETDISPFETELLNQHPGIDFQKGGQNPGDDGGSGGGEEPNLPSTPLLQSPSNGASDVSVNPNFSWSSVSADSYTLRVYSSGNLVFENTGKGTSYTTPSSRTLAYDTGYSWRVRATRDGLTSDWSSSRSFTTESGGSGDDSSGSGSDPLTSPDLSSPKNGATGVSLTPTLEWNSLNADYYILQLENSSTETLVIDTEVNGTSYSVKNNESLNNETLYKWRVHGVKDGVPGEWSSIAEFTTQAEGGGNGNNGRGPQKSTPAKDEKKVSKKTTFKWESVESAESYTIEVREASTSTLFVAEEVTDTMYVSAREMKGNTEYVWRVRATVQGQVGEWSDEWEFTTTDENEETALEVELSQNYPNPFNPSTNIRFTINEQQEVSLKVYDMAGRLVANLIDGSTLSAGTHNASFNANSLASGIYFYRLITPGEIVTRKMTLMK